VPPKIIAMDPATLAAVAADVPIKINDAATAGAACNVDVE
jgi:hypothetical protein